MKTAGRENPNSRDRLCTEPSPWSGRSEPSSLIHTGWRVRKYPAAGEVFFLTSPFIELIRTYPAFDAGASPRIPSEWATIRPESGVYSGAAWGPNGLSRPMEENFHATI